MLKAVEKEVGIKPGETTSDGKLSLLTARCMGSCGLAPAVVFDGAIHGKMSSTAVLQNIRRLLNHDD
jgi:bidirectional [NiFe] hydrogenase diaphorase subunit